VIGRQSLAHLWDPRGSASRRSATGRPASQGRRPQTAPLRNSRRRIGLCARGCGPARALRGEQIRRPS
jgi:hypothetical protein